MKASAEARSTSSYLYVRNSYSTEQIMRALLLSDQIRILWSGRDYADRGDLDRVEPLIECGRLVLLDELAVGRWFDAAEADPTYLPAWHCYFAQRFLQAAEAGSVDVLVERDGMWPSRPKGRLIDTGELMVPPPLLGRDGPIRYPSLDGRICSLKAATQLDPLSQSLQAAILEALPSPYSIVAWDEIHDRACEVLTLEQALRDVEASADDYAHLGVLGYDRRQVQWIAGLLQDRTDFDCQNDRSVSAVMDSAMSHRFSLTQVPMDRFIDLCDSLAVGRSMFTQKVMGWSSAVAAVDSDPERWEKLRQIRRDEIVPAMRQFNEDAQTNMRKIVGDITGAQVANVILGGIAAAICVCYQAPIDETVVPAAKIAALGAVSNVAKSMWDRKQKSRRTWMAFASALSDEAERLRRMQ